MPASGDLKYGESLSFALLPLPHSPDKHNWPIPQIIAWVWQYMTSYMKYRPSKFSWQNKNIFVSGKVHAKFPKTVLWIKEIFEKNGSNSKTKHRKAQKPILSGRFVDLDRKLGDGYCIWKSWHIFKLKTILLAAMHNSSVTLYHRKITDSLFWIF